MIWNIYNLDDDRPIARYYLCSYDRAEKKAFKKFGPEVMIIDWKTDRLRLKAMKDFNDDDLDDQGLMPDKGGSYGR